MRGLITKILAGAVIAPLSLAQAAIVDVEVSNFAFTPRVVTINVGDTVRWVWVSGSHTTTSGNYFICSPDEMWNNPITSSNPTFEFTFDTVGLFNYFCVPHCLSDMNGEVNVEELSPTEHTSWAQLKWIYR